MRFWLQGGLVEAERATVGVLDHGFTVGDGVFETLKTVADATAGVVPFAMDRHIARLCRSAAAMGLAPPDPEEVRHAMLAVCAANAELAEGGRMRVTLTSGPGPLGSDRNADASTLVVAVSPATPWPVSTTLALSPWPRNERSPLAGIKSTSYAENVLALARARSRGAGEALLGNLAGDVCEGTGSNVFVVIEGQVMTPPLTSGCLAGITRELLLEWCAAAGSEIEQRAIPLGDIAYAEEIFITSSTRDVQPVSAVHNDAGEPLWVGGAVERTRAAAGVFGERAATNWNP